MRRRLVAFFAKNFIREWGHRYYVEIMLFQVAANPVAVFARLSIQAYYSDDFIFRQDPFLSLFGSAVSALGVENNLLLGSA
jgi:hypothetical protein